MPDGVSAAVEWDAAFELVDRYGAAGDLETLFADALDQLLNAGEARDRETWIGRSEARPLLIDPSR